MEKLSGLYSTLKKTLILLITVFLTQLAFGQSSDELMKMWNSEIVKIGDREKDRIDSEIKDINPFEKVLLSTLYSKGKLKIFRQSQSIRKLVKTYMRHDTIFTERYYFMGRWPLYAEIEHSYQKTPDKFYFDKTNLMLWIDSDLNEYTIENAKANDWWWKLLESMDKLMIAADSEKKHVNEDQIKQPELPPMSKKDSLQLIELKKQFEGLMKTIPDSLKK